MTAYQPVCNGRVGDLICDERFQAPPEAGFVSVSVTRQMAREAGWTYVPRPLMQSVDLDQDFCPAHRPEN